MFNLGEQKNIILGGMFFQEFFGVFTNDYSGAEVSQQVQIYLSNDVVGVPYAGNSSLPTGVNPW